MTSGQLKPEIKRTLSPEQALDMRDSASEKFFDFAGKFCSSTESIGIGAQLKRRESGVGESEISKYYEDRMNRDNTFIDNKGNVVELSYDQSRGSSEGPYTLDEGQMIVHFTDKRRLFVSIDKQRSHGCALEATLETPEADAPDKFTRRNVKIGHYEGEFPHNFIDPEYVHGDTALLVMADDILNSINKETPSRFLDNV